MIELVGAKTLLTVEQFEQLPDEEASRYELDQGELIELSAASYQHNRIRDRVVGTLNRYLAEHPVGEAVAEQELLVAEDTVRRPDVAFIRAEVVAGIDRSKSILQVAPDLVVEIASPSDTAAQLMRKVNQYLAHGSRAVWVIYPVDRKAHVFGPNDEVCVLGEGKNLEAPALLPGFSPAVREIFG